MTEDERAIRALVQRWMDATAAGDSASVLDLMTDDVVFMVPGREPFGKEAFANAAQAQQSQKIDGKSDVVEVKVLGDWAYLRNHLKITVTPETGAAVRREGYTLTILRKGDDGKWRLARDANLLTVRA